MFVSLPSLSHTHNHYRYVPNSWGHGVLNLAENIGFAVEFKWKGLFNDFTNTVQLGGVQCPPHKLGLKDEPCAFQGFKKPWG